MLPPSPTPLPSVEPSKPTRLASLKTAFFAGLFMLSPLAITWLVVSWAVEQVGGRFRDWFFFYVPDELLAQPNLGLLWNVLATLIVLLLVTILGYFSRNLLGRMFGHITERALLGLPGVSAIYNAAKQIITTFSTQNRNLFSKVVVVEFPRRGSWVLGFITNKAQGEPQIRAGEGGTVPPERWTVFVPTSPNPTSGFLLLLPREEITELDMSVGDGMKFVISGGSFVPPWGRDEIKN
ncbi:DUF502 domain-containing protein [Geminisphaera colitermitum]|uniref:DUF502 domain-containing protein n=1 Tax=Geminisphaera colitermitum TaxID=1148786 RepID=UPI000158D18C|nr:DUF502 domain-containing protein [Geminisphaera colitermitum]